MPINVLCYLLAPLAALSSSAPQAQVVPAVTLPTVVVTAQKEPADAQRLPVSVTAVSSDLIESQGITTIGEAAANSPNTHLAELSARKISNAFMRGIGSSPANPGITTFIDGVPQLNSNSSNVELLDVGQVEFVRGPQSALFGRNTLGGLVSVATARPSLTEWTGRLAVPFGSEGSRDVRANVSGPLGGSVAAGFSFGHSQRDGFTINDVTGHALDSRSANVGKAQVLWAPTATWEVRLIGYGERDRDGDYALGDLADIRRNPFHVARDFEGRTDRNIWSTTAILRHEGRQFAFSSTTGFVSWSTHDLTDLDYSPLPLVTRDNAEKDRQFTQEIRIASSPAAPARLNGAITLAWQTGFVLFTQHYTQDAINSFSPYVLSPVLPIPVSQHSPLAALDDTGVAVYGQGTVSIGGALDASIGARVDRERKTADLSTYYAPAIAPPLVLNAERTFSDVSPQASLAFHAGSGRTVYVSAGRGFKAGGFNPASPAGSEAYGEEHAWNVEGGLKTVWANGRVSVNADVYRIGWNNMQLNVPNPLVPAQFYIANVGTARSSGLEFEVTARPREGLDFIAAAGVTRAHFGSGSTSGGVDVSGRELPNAPDYTASVGAQLSRSLGSRATCFGRADIVFTGAYHYDESNLQGQSAYSLVNVRGGLRSGRLRAEAWVKNAFDTRYVPVAFAFGGLTPSGFLGENGRPRTYGVSLEIGF